MPSMKMQYSIEGGHMYYTGKHGLWSIDCWPEWYEVRLDGESLEKFKDFTAALKAIIAEEKKPVYDKDKACSICGEMPSAGFEVISVKGKNICMKCNQTNFLEG